MNTFAVIIQLVRIPVRNEPEKLTSFEQYVLIDALSFFKAGMSFPERAEPITYLEYMYLKESYKLYYMERQHSIHGPVFEEGMRQVDTMGGLNVSR